jgi:ABC-type amino acid transport substrate-binding protein
MTFSGYVPDLIDILQSRMGFTYELIFQTNITYPKIMKNVEDGFFDMLVSDVTMTLERREVANFSCAIFDTVLRIMVRKESNVTTDLLLFLRPFTWGLWLLILVANIYAGCLLFLYERQANDALRHESIISSTAMCCWFSIGTLIGYGVDFRVRTAAGRLLTTGLYVLSLILVLVATYTANVASNLTLLKSHNIISGIEDIKNGKIPSTRIGIRINTATEEYYLREIFYGIRDFYLLKSRDEAINSQLNGVINVIFIDSATAVSLTGSFYCNLTLVGVPFDSGAFRIVISKQWIYGEELGIIMNNFIQKNSSSSFKIK